MSFASAFGTFDYEPACHYLQIIAPKTDFEARVMDNSVVDGVDEAVGAFIKDVA